jgi:hypothetical protein
MIRITPIRSPQQSELVSDAAHWLDFIKTRLNIPSPIIQSRTARNFLDGIALDAGTGPSGERYFSFDDESRLTICENGEVAGRGG